jgi:electron transfer flavoprotein alpha subunit
MATYHGVWVLVEQQNGRLLDISLEMLGHGQKVAHKLRQDLSAILLGENVGSLTDEVAAYGADKVYVADSIVLNTYRGEAYSLVLKDLIYQFRPEIFIIGGTSLGMDLAPRVAAKVNTGLSAHAMDIDIDANGCLIAHMPAFGGAVMASIACPKHRPQMVTIPSGFVKKPEKRLGRKPEIKNIEVKVSEDSLRTKVIKVFQEGLKAKPLDSADVVVCGGFGVGSKEKWRMVEELAATLNGSVGATRPACDEGWAIQEEHMVGQSGKTIHPNLYIGIGISGVIHHLIGIKDSKVIVAINNDPKAPIMKAADYAIVADYKEVVPALIQEFKKIAEKS